jgi:RND family efflux transporter MFP subunit
MKKWMTAMVMASVMSGPVAFAGAQEEAHGEEVEALELSASQVQALGLKTAAPEPVRSVKGYAWPALVKTAFDHRFTLAAPLEGRVSAIHTLHGQVRAGDPLVTLESDAFADLQRAFLDAIAELQRAEKDFKRAKRLYKAGSLSEKVYLAARAAYQKAQHARQSTAAALLYVGWSKKQVEQLAQSGQITRRLTLRAPADGIVEAPAVALNEQVEMGQTLLPLRNLNGPVIETHVPPRVLKQLRIGQPAVIENTPLVGQVAFVDASVDADTQRGMVHIRLNQPRGVLPGELVRVQFVDTFSKQPWWRVPTSSVVTLEGDAAVFVQDGDHFRPQRVEVRHRDAQWAVVRWPNEEKVARVVSQGAIFLKGMMEGEEGEGGAGHGH